MKDDLNILSQSIQSINYFNDYLIQSKRELKAQIENSNTRHQIMLDDIETLLNSKKINFHKVDEILNYKLRINYDFAVFNPAISLQQTFHEFDEKKLLSLRKESIKIKNNKNPPNNIELDKDFELQRESYEFNRRNSLGLGLESISSDEKGTSIEKT